MQRPIFGLYNTYPRQVTELFRLPYLLMSIIGIVINLSYWNPVVHVGNRARRKEGRMTCSCSTA